ncbi:NAD-dependent epimerase/dehydratase family protein (plasmid) [Pseudovibrio brasiliensis]|uniref:NAD-dependent epimerase/dehydratase family protein n=2 Tax=Pseudovibrio brasiliensis TaxID=1898042 RepID=A0ABX8AU18_9HYPH|nr:NAD-dependent epimerase/dehydratase family protein [Pseudovibrio brasiliensis]
MCNENVVLAQFRSARAARPLDLEGLMSKAEVKTICIAGASGLAGAYMVKEALVRGYRVNGTMRDISQLDKVSGLMRLPGAAERLHLFSADTSEPESFDAPLTQANAVFIACIPTLKHGADGTPAAELDRERGISEIIRPAEQACLNILKAAQRQGTKTAVLCSSTASAEPATPSFEKHEDKDISDAEMQIQQRKYAQAQKTVMEATAEAFTEEHGMRLCTFLPSMMVGAPLLPSHLKGHVLSFLAKLRYGKTGWHSAIPVGSMSLTSPDDLAKMSMAALENPKAAGRYFALSGSWSWARIYQEIAEYVPLEALPTPLGKDPEPPTRFDFSKRDSLGVPVRGIQRMFAEFYEAYEQVRLAPQA